VQFAELLRELRELLGIDRAGHGAQLLERRLLVFGRHQELGVRNVQIHVVGRGRNGRAVGFQRLVLLAGSLQSERAVEQQIRLFWRTFEPAVGNAQRAVSSTVDPKELAKLAQKFGKLHAFADCIAMLDKAIKGADTADLHVRRAVCRHEQKDDAGAQSDYEAALKLDDKFAPAHYYLAQHVCPTDKKKAAEQFKKAAELGGESELGKKAAELAGKAKAGKCH